MADALPISVYRNRAANQPKPADFQEPEHLLAPVKALPGHVFYSDTSEFQQAYNADYTSPIASFRIDSGYRLDNIVNENWSYLSGALNRGTLKIAIGYIVFIPGQLSGVLARVKSVLGDKPNRRVAIMIDMESGPGFAGSSANFSAEANQWAAAFASYLGTWARVIAYANQYDYASNWPARDPRTKKHTAAYGTTDPTPYGWQYSGGIDSAVLPGYPTSMAPFGTYVDLNVIPKTIEQIEADFGITSTPAPTPTEDDDMKQYVLFQQANAIYESDGMTYRHLSSPPVVVGIQSFLKARGGDYLVHKTGQPLEVYGVPISGTPAPAKLEDIAGGEQELDGIEYGEDF